MKNEFDENSNMLRQMIAELVPIPFQEHSEDGVIGGTKRSAKYDSAKLLSQHLQQIYKLDGESDVY